MRFIRYAFCLIAVAATVCAAGCKRGGGNEVVKSEGAPPGASTIGVRTAPTGGAGNSATAKGALPSAQ